MSRGTLVSVELRLDPVLRSFINSGWKPEDGRDVMQVAETEMAEHNFPDLQRYNQGVWTPLTRNYKNWKQKHYPGRLKWELTGSAMEALSTPVKLGVTGGEWGPKSITLDSSKPGVVSAEYAFKKPAAGGYFMRTNRLRTIWDLMFKSRVKIETGIRDLLAMKFRDAGFK